MFRSVSAVRWNMRTYYVIEQINKIICAYFRHLITLKCLLLALLSTALFISNAQKGSRQSNCSTILVYIIFFTQTSQFVLTAAPL